MHCWRHPLALALLFCTGYATEFPPGILPAIIVTRVQLHFLATVQSMNFLFHLYDCWMNLYGFPFIFSSGNERLYKLLDEKKGKRKLFLLFFLFLKKSFTKEQLFQERSQDFPTFVACYILLSISCYLYLHCSSCFL